MPFLKIYSLTISRFGLFVSFFFSLKKTQNATALTRDEFFKTTSDLTCKFVHKPSSGLLRPHFGSFVNERRCERSEKVLFCQGQSADLMYTFRNPFFWKTGGDGFHCGISEGFLDLTNTLPAPRWLFPCCTIGDKITGASCRAVLAAAPPKLPFCLPLSDRSWPVFFPCRGGFPLSRKYVRTQNVR